MWVSSNRLYSNRNRIEALSPQTAHRTAIQGLTDLPAFTRLTTDIGHYSLIVTGGRPVHRPPEQHNRGPAEPFGPWPRRVLAQRLDVMSLPTPAR
jgi:hypothetical protein